jgi:hypothetical protein
MAPASDISAIGAAPAIAPVAAVGVAAVSATVLRPASNAASVAGQLVAEVAATLIEGLPGSQPPAPQASALTEMVGQAATQQDSLAPLLADLAVAVNAPAMPADARATAAQILAAQTPLGADVTAAQLRSAAQGSGVFLEAGLAAAVVSGDEVATANLQLDLKALLLQLSSELAPFIAGPAPARPAAPTTSPRGTAVRGSTDQLEPPVGGGPVTGQPAARASLDAQAHTDLLVRTLQQEAQGALARVQLSQAASVERSGETTRWMFEVPIATPGGAGVAQFEISRDGHGPGAGGEAAEPSWRARFSVNVSPSGPVHADVMLAKGRARVTLMAEDAAARQALDAHRDELTEALAAEQADVAVRVIGGAPPRPLQPAGQLVDRRS